MFLIVEGLLIKEKQVIVFCFRSRGGGGHKKKKKKTCYVNNDGFHMGMEDSIVASKEEVMTWGFDAHSGRDVAEFLKTHNIFYYFT